MEWIKTVIVTTSAGSEPIMAELLDLEVDGVQIDDPREFKELLESSSNWDYAEPGLMDDVEDRVTLTFYLPVNSANETLCSISNYLETLKEQNGSPEFDGLEYGELSLQTEKVDDSGWLTEWKKYYKPFRVGNKIIVRPIWEEYTPEEGDVVLTLDPGHAFGTGQHHSTRLCMEAIERHIQPDMEVADIGCGSGILAITALLLGAKYAVGVDIDENAVKTANENAEINGLSNYNFLTGNVLSDGEFLREVSKRKYQLISANIVADAIIELAPLAYDFIDKDGIFITGGIIRERANETVAAIEKAGFAVLTIDTSDEWVCVSARKNQMRR